MGLSGLKYWIGEVKNGIVWVGVKDPTASRIIVDRVHFRARGFNVFVLAEKIYCEGPCRGARNSCSVGTPLALNIGRGCRTSSLGIPGVDGALR